MVIFFSLLLIVLSSVVLFSPYRSWPVSGHFGLFSIWTLFRDRSKHLPKHLMLKNFSLSRIFMHYTVEMTAVVFGKKNLGMKVMYVQFGVFSLSAVLIYLVALLSLGLGNTAALFGALLFLFVATRPQFIPDFSNAEPFYVCLAIAAMGVLLLHAQTADQAFLRVCIFAFIFVFAALNAKVHFLFEPAVIGFTYVLATGGRFDLVAALALGFFAALAFFFVLMRRNIRKETIGWLQNLVNYNRTVSQFSFAGLLRGLRGRYAMALSRSPLTGLVVLGLLCAAFSPWDVTTLLLLVWAVTAAVVISVQGRFELYHFVVMFPALVLLTVRGLQHGYDAYGVPGLWMLLPAAFLARRSFKLFPVFFNQKTPLAQRLALAIDCYPYYWEIRFNPVIDHLRAHPAPALAWGITPEFYHLADSAPVSSVTYIHRQMDYLQPSWGTVLREDVAKVAPVWVYDFNCWNEVYGRFNPVSFYFATGLEYRAVKRQENVGYYALQNTGGVPVPPLGAGDEALHFSVYGLQSQLRSLLEDALRKGGYDVEALPPFWRLDAAPLLALLAQGRPLGVDRLDGEETRLWEAHPRELAVWRILTHLHRGEAEAGKALYAAIGGRQADIARMSLLARIILECIGRMLREGVQPLRIAAEEINSLPVVDMFHVLNTLLALADTEVLLAEEKRGLFACLKDLQLDGGDYRDAAVCEVEHVLAAVKGIDAAAVAERLARHAAVPRMCPDSRNSYVRLYAEAGAFAGTASALPKAAAEGPARIILYGLTDDVPTFLAQLPESVQVVCIADTFKHETVTELQGVPVVSPKLLAQHPCDALLLMMTVPSSIQAVCSWLRQSGFAQPVYSRRFEVSSDVWERIRCD
jgi:hypothetical protein